MTGWQIAVLGGCLFAMLSVLLTISRQLGSIIVRLSEIRSELRQGLQGGKAVSHLVNIDENTRPKR